MTWRCHHGASLPESPLTTLTWLFKLCKAPIFWKIYLNQSQLWVNYTANWGQGIKNGLPEEFFKIRVSRWFFRAKCGKTLGVQQNGPREYVWWKTRGKYLVRASLSASYFSSGALSLAGAFRMSKRNNHFFQNSTVRSSNPASIRFGTESSQALMN